MSSPRDTALRTVCPGRELGALVADLYGLRVRDAEIVRPGVNVTVRLVAEEGVFYLGTGTHHARSHGGRGHGHRRLGRASRRALDR